MMFSAVTMGGGSWIFVIFLVVMFFAFGWSYYTRRGSGINLRPWHERGSSAEGNPPSLSHDQSEDVRNWTRGTRPPRESARAARRRRTRLNRHVPTGSRAGRLSIRRKRPNPEITDTTCRPPDSPPTRPGAEPRALRPIKRPAAGQLDRRSGA
jgi:hypothetical protein